MGSSYDSDSNSDSNQHDSDSDSDSNHHDCDSDSDSTKTNYKWFRLRNRNRPLIPTPESESPQVWSRDSEDPAKHPHLRGSNLPLGVHLHRRSDYGLINSQFQPERNLLMIQTQYSGQFISAWPCSPHTTVCRWCHSYLSSIPGTWEGQRSSVLLYSVLFAGFHFSTYILFLPRWSSACCWLRPFAITPVRFGYL